MFQLHVTNLGTFSMNGSPSSLQVGLDPGILAENHSDATEGNDGTRRCSEGVKTRESRKCLLKMNNPPLYTPLYIPGSSFCV